MDAETRTHPGVTSMNMCEFSHGEERQGWMSLDGGREGALNCYKPCLPCLCVLP